MNVSFLLQHLNYLHFAITLKLSIFFLHQQTLKHSKSTLQYTKMQSLKYFAFKFVSL